jgi:hypothetical protein
MVVGPLSSSMDYKAFMKYFKMLALHRLFTELMERARRKIEWDRIVAEHEMETFETWRRMLGLEANFYADVSRILGSPSPVHRPIPSGGLSYRGDQTIRIIPDTEAFDWQSTQSTSPPRKPRRVTQKETHRAIIRRKEKKRPKEREVRSNSQKRQFYGAYK